MLGVAFLAFYENLFHAYGGASLVPIAVSETCLILLLKSKKLRFSANSAILAKSSVGLDFWFCLSKASLRVLIPALQGVSWDIIPLRLL